jgi:NAD(P)-dependent dehydrogenase (short-subunit alcohol dehydrogenase family)
VTRSSIREVSAVSEFAGKTVLVTGASRGVGRATAREFASLGARVGLIGRDTVALDELAAELGDSARAVVADVTEPGECARAVGEVVAALGPIDLLISNAGMLYRDFVEDVKQADFELSWRAYVGGALWLTQRVLPSMRERGYGRIVFVSSELGLIGAPSYASYCSAKWGLIGLAEVLHHELVGSPVRVCVVCPGDIQTAQLSDDLGWGPTAGVASIEKAMSPEYVARRVVRAAAGRSELVVIDRLPMRAFFKIVSGPRGLSRTLVHGAFKPLLKSRPRSAAS